MNTISQKDMAEHEREYRAGCDMCALIEAAKIRKDPERLERVKAKIDAKREELKNLKV
jgi:hypothetical protein